MRITIRASSELLYGIIRFSVKNDCAGELRTEQHSHTYRPTKGPEYPQRYVIPRSCVDFSMSSSPECLFVMETLGQCCRMLGCGLDGGSGIIGMLVHVCVCGTILWTLEAMANLDHSYLGLLECLVEPWLSNSVVQETGGSAATLDARIRTRIQLV